MGQFARPGKSANHKWAICKANVGPTSIDHLWHPPRYQKTQRGNPAISYRSEDENYWLGYIILLKMVNIWLLYV
jgi:hypothetical protein